MRLTVAVAVELRHFVGVIDCVAEWDGEKVTLGLPDGELVVEAERQSVDEGDSEAVIVDDKQRELLWLMVLDTDPVLDTVELTDGEKETLGLPEGELVGEAERQSVAVEDSEFVMEADKQRVLLLLMLLHADPVLEPVGVAVVLRHREGV